MHKTDNRFRLPQGLRQAAALLPVFAALAWVCASAQAAPQGELAAKETRHIASTFPGRMAGTQKEDLTARYLADRLLAMGYKPTLHRFFTSYTFNWESKPARYWLGAIPAYRLNTLLKRGMEPKPAA